MEGFDPAWFLSSGRSLRLHTKIYTTGGNSLTLWRLEDRAQPLEMLGNRHEPVIPKPFSSLAYCAYACARAGGTCPGCTPRTTCRGRRRPGRSLACSRDRA